MANQEVQVHHKTKAEDRIPFKQLVAYGFGGIIPIALFNIAGQLMGLIGNISLGLSALWLGVILIIPRLWDAVSDPIVGHISDNTRTRWGRRRPYLLVGGISVALSFVLMWWIPDGEWVHSWFPSDAGYQWFQLFYILFWLLIFFTACTIFEIPHGALGMEMSSDYHERTRLFSSKSFLGNLFAMSTPWLFALANMEIFKGIGGNEADGMRYVSMMVAAILIPLSFWWFFTVREPGFKVAKKQEKTPFWKSMKHTASNKTFLRLVMIIFTLAMGFNFVNLLGYYIPIFYIFGGDKSAAVYLLGINGTIWAITGLVAVFPLNWLSSRFGKRKTIIIAISLMVLAQLSKIICYNPTYPYLIIIPTILLSSGMLFFFTLGSSMVGDICDEDDLKTGYRSEGSYYSIFWWFIKMGTALASLVAGLLIVFTQFDETQVTSVDDLQGSIKETLSMAHNWGGYDSIDSTNTDWLKNTKTYSMEALKESKEFLSYLNLESLKNQEKQDQVATTAQIEEENLIESLVEKTTTTIAELEQLQTRIEKIDTHGQPSELKSILGEAIPLTLRTPLEKARFNSSKLLSHLEAQSLENDNSQEHYVKLIKNITEINNRLTSSKATLGLDSFTKELNSIDEGIVPLTEQAPYTLIMMRVVEIGLPLLLSLISIIFAFRYSLTEDRCYEIKEALEIRNKARLIGEAN
ncbi:MAG: MFS transporter [Bacteroidales bacterium]|nr:MFS transporter [Bacteroidales bacterium]MCF8455576.1 MFS transporter [Bacteroidales bacterium]